MIQKIDPNTILENLNGHAAVKEMRPNDLQKIFAELNDEVQRKLRRRIEDLLRNSPPALITLIDQAGLRFDQLSRIYGRRSNAFRNLPVGWRVNKVASLGINITRGMLFLADPAVRSG